MQDFEPINPQNYDESKHCVFVGHGVIYDLKVMNLTDVPFICTSKVDMSEIHQAKKLKDLSRVHLNALIQEGHHSSIIDSRCTLALFLKFREQLEERGLQFLNAEEIMSTGIAKRRKKAKLTAAAMENLPGMHSLGGGH